MHSMDFRPIQQRDRCLPALLEEPQEICFLPLFPHREGSKENSAARHCYNNVKTPAWQVKPMVSKGTPYGHLQPNSNTQDRKYSFGPNVSKPQTSEKRNTRVTGMVSFR